MPLPGPYFKFLVLPVDTAWERIGRSQRRGGIRQELFHHPDALRVPNCILGALAPAFISSYPQFHYYGPTEYAGEPLASLIAQLIQSVQNIEGCRTADELEQHLPAWVVSDFSEMLGPWPHYWREAQRELVMGAECILTRAEVAQRKAEALLVFGI